MNAEKMGQSNKSALFRAIRSNPCITRRELASVTGLDPSTVTKITSVLLEKGLIKERGVIESDQPGRKSIKLSVTKHAAAAIVAELGVEETRLGLGYLNNSVKPGDVFSTPGDMNIFFDHFCKSVVSLYERFISDVRIVSLCLSVPGMVEDGKSLLRDLPHLGWKDVNFREEFRKRLPSLPLDIDVVNEAQLALMAERAFNGKISEFDNGVYVYLSQGVGGALMLDGNIYRGTSNIAGEVGHMTIDPEGPMCHCGNRGCLESFFSIDEVVLAFERSGGDLGLGTFRERFSRLMDLAGEGNVAARRILDSRAQYLVIGISNLVNILNPAFVMLGGMGHIVPDYFVRAVQMLVEKRVLRSARNKVRILRSSLEISDATLLGGTLLAMDLFSEKAVI